MAVETVIAKAADAAVVPTTHGNEAVSGVVQKLSELGLEPNIVFGFMALAIAVATVLVLFAFMRRQSSGHVSYDQLMERLDRLEITLREGTVAGRSNSEVKGTIGYFKQELTDIRAMVFALQQQLGAVEQFLSNMEQRTALSSETAIDRPGAATVRRATNTRRPQPGADYLSSLRQRQPSLP